MATAVEWSQYFILRSLSSIVHCFDVDENMRTVGAFGSLYTKLSKRRRERAMDNLRRSFPQLNEHEVEKIAEESIRNMFQLFAVDSETGETLWKGELLGGEGTANPMTYQTGDGKQFIVIGVTGSGWDRGLIAFALPDG